MILLIDNYDSFVYNLYQLIGEFDSDIKVVRNDKITLDEIRALNPRAIFLSPGPKHPVDAGICIDVVKCLGGEYPIFGVCLGHQSICHAYGGVVSHASKLMHGKTSVARLDDRGVLFRGCGRQMQVARYHSLAAERKSLPDCLRVTALTAEGDIMAVEHKEYEVYGVQFHPESVLTPDGKKIIENFLRSIEL